jgi:acetoin utilization deacetylase AcuC-like enzyme
MDPVKSNWPARLRSALTIVGLLWLSCAGLEAAPEKPATGFVYSGVYLEHQTGSGHPERPERLTAIVRRFTAEGLWTNLVPLAPREAPLECIVRVHAQAYIARVKNETEAGVGYVDTADAPASTNSYRVALLAAGGVLSAVDGVMTGAVRNAFCAVRPPGHHALRERAMGFCLFNNVAIAARYVQARYGLARVLIVDWDVHHGNGTQAAFYEDPTVLYFSVHQSPFYPGTGQAEERGQGPGLGFTVNVPLPAGSGDADYKRVFEEKLKPAAAAFKPDFVLISAGFDAAAGALLGGMKVTSAGYAQFTRAVRGIADEQCKGRLVSVLEGGYNLDRLAAAVEAHVRALME